MVGVSTAPDDGYRLYGELASWWPLISPPGEYAAEAEYLAALLSARPDGGARAGRRAARPRCPNRRWPAGPPPADWPDAGRLARPASGRLTIGR